MAQRKETKKTIKIRDLTPRKDTKGGVARQNISRAANQHQSVNQGVNQGVNQSYNQG